MYKLIDSGNFEKLEQIGDFRIRRPAASATWTPKLTKEWDKVDATFVRGKEGDGEWKIRNEKIKNSFVVEVSGTKFILKLTSFGHLGIFAEQEKNWLQLREHIAGQKLKVLNLFAYTGGSSLFCAQAGAEVVHVDASKGTVKWASDNAKENNISTIRWIVDDVNVFIEKELRRGNKYDGIILDPPSYGRGPDKQIWKIEDHLTPMLQKLQKLFSDRFSFLLLSCHSQGYTPISLKNQIEEICGKGNYISEEMVIVDQQGRPLPSGCSCLFTRP